MSAVEELIWNGLDADATIVEVGFTEDDIGGVLEITVSDNGVGITPERATPAFGGVGGSWKRGAASEAGRLLHGRHGRGGSGF